MAVSKLAAVCMKCTSVCEFQHESNMIFVSVQPSSTFDHTVRGALSAPSTSRAQAPGFATQDRAKVRDSNAAKDNTQDMEANSENLLRKECQGCSKV